MSRGWAAIRIIEQSPGRLNVSLSVMNTYSIRTLDCKAALVAVQSFRRVNTSTPHDVSFQNWRTGEDNEPEKPNDG